MSLKFLLTVGLLWSSGQCYSTPSDRKVTTVDTLFENDGDRLSETISNSIDTIDNENRSTSAENDMSNKTALTYTPVISTEKPKNSTDSNIVTITNSTSTTSITPTTTSSTTTTTTTTTTTAATAKSTTASTITAATTIFESTPAVNSITTEPPEISPNSKDNSTVSRSYNYYYLFLLLIIPIVGFSVGVYYRCRRKKEDGYIQPVRRANETRRRSTPSWVFSEPEFTDEEIITMNCRR